MVAEGGAFNGGGGGLLIGNDETTMEIDMSGGRWQRRASAFTSAMDKGGRWRLTVAMDGRCGSGGR
jgi:hypothetical protein